MVGKEEFWQEFRYHIKELWTEGDIIGIFFACIFYPIDYFFGPDGWQVQLILSYRNQIGRVMDCKSIYAGSSPVGSSKSFDFKCPRCNKNCSGNVSSHIVNYMRCMSLFCENCNLSIQLVFNVMKCMTCSSCIYRSRQTVYVPFDGLNIQ